MEMRLVFLLSVLLWTAQDADEFIHRDHGFKVCRPDAGWSAVEVPPIDHARFGFKIQRKNLKSDVSVTIHEADDAIDATAAADGAETSMKADSRCSEITRGKGKVGGVDAHRVHVCYTIAKERTIIDYYYVTHGGALFLLTVMAPDGDLKENARSLQAILDSFAFVDPPDPKARERDLRLKKLAAKCGRQVSWAATWKEASERASKEKRLVLVVVEQYRGFAFEKMAPSTTFCDAEFIDLVNERFVPFAWADSTTAPFQDPAVYGMGPSVFGQGVLFVAPDGRVIGEGVTLNPTYLDIEARAVLAKHREFTGPAIDASLKGLDRAEAHLRRGELAEAEKLLTDVKDGRGWLLQARLLRRMRLGRRALAALKNAREAGAEVDIEEAVVRLRLGEFAAAEKILAGTAAPEGKYWLAIARGMQRGLEPIRKELIALTETAEETPWAWRAAALLRGQGIMTGIERAAWPAEEDLADAEQRPYATATAAKAEKGAVDFLVKCQHRDGSWTTSTAICAPSSADGIAATSICATALLPHRKLDGVQAALERALAFVFAAQAGGVLDADARRQFDHAIWGQVFALRFLARCVQASVGDRKKLLAAMSAIVDALKVGQREGGGWSYVRLGADDDNSIGFVTAVAIEALREAKDGGVDVPAAMVEKAVAVVKSLCNTKGTFGYMQATGPGATEAESSRRGPLYAMALKRAGKGDAAAVRAALDQFLKQAAHTRRERGKGLCHTGPEGTASYYLLFGAMHAAEAVGELPADDREKIRKALLEDVLHFRTDDGGFCDNPGIGRMVGAGMALEALRLLQ